MKRSRAGHSGRTPADVRTLLNHLMYWTGSRFEAAAHRVPPTESPAEGHDVTAEPAWADQYTAGVRAAAAAWSEPAAWEGVSGLSGAGTMPARQ
ncbi:MAG: hypothetical protein ACJ72W_14200 [Actinoallomurus sp.]